MKATRSGILPTLCLAVLALACVGTPDEPAVTPVSEGDEIGAGIEVETPATKTSVADLKIFWSEGDQLSVFPKLACNSKYILKNGAGEQFGIFTKVQGPLTGKAYPGYAAVYPYDETVTLAGDGTLSLSFPQVQTYAADGFGPGASPMVAWSETTRLQFFNMGAFLVLELNGNTRICSIEVTALGGEALAGPVSAAPGKDGPVITFPEGDEGSDSLTLRCDEPVQLEEDEDTPFWIVVPPIVLEKGFKVAVTCENGSCIESTFDQEAEFVRNQIFRMDPLEITVEKTCLDYVMDDYRTLVANFPNIKDHFVEARFVLNDIISETEAGELQAESVATYCYVWHGGYSEIDVLERDFKTGETRMYQYFADSPWVGDMSVPESEMKALPFSLEDALLNAKNDPEAAGSDGLDTRYVTLRKPLWPVWDNPQYVIGGSASRNSHVFVDALDGTVKVLEGGSDGGGSSLAFLGEDLNIIRDIYWMDEPLGFPLEVRGFFTEAHYVLNKAMNELQASDLFPETVTYVFYVPADGDVPDNYLVRGMRDLTKGFSVPIETTAEIATDPWTGGGYFTPYELDELIGVEDAIYIVKLGNVKDPDTADVTLCRPDGKPVYVFRGEGTPTVVVDAISGDILTD